MPEKKKFVIGSRGSKLSLAYSEHVKDLLLKSNLQLGNNSIEIKIIKTSGDLFQKAIFLDSQLLHGFRLIWIIIFQD